MMPHAASDVLRLNLAIVFSLSAKVINLALKHCMQAHVFGRYDPAKDKINGRL
jgi:hypothetical protein